METKKLEKMDLLSIKRGYLKQAKGPKLTYISYVDGYCFKIAWLLGLMNGCHAITKKCRFIP